MKVEKNLIEKVANGKTLMKGEPVGNAKMYEEAQICDFAKVYDNTEIFGKAEVYGYAEIFENARICGNAKIFGGEVVFEDEREYGSAYIRGNAFIKNDNEHFGFDCSDLFNCHIHVYRSIDNEIVFTLGYFCGNMEEFEKEVEETYSGKISKEECNRIIEEIRTKLD